MMDLSLSNSLAQVPPFRLKLIITIPSENCCWRRIPSSVKKFSTIKQMRHSQSLRCASDAQILSTSALVESRSSGIDVSDEFYGGFGRLCCENDIPEEECTTSGISVGEIRKNRSLELIFGYATGSGEDLCSRGSLDENGKHITSRAKMLKQVSHGRKQERAGKKYVRISEHGKSDFPVVKKGKSYGGSIPAMLKAVNTIDDLDDALRPWEMTLTNKERSILLKEQQRWERALDIFKWFQSKGCYEINVIHYNIMFRLLGKAQRWCEVERLWGEMEKRGIKPINSTYGTLIDVCCKGGYIDKAKKWLDLMNEHEMEPDEVTMGTVVQMYKKIRDFVSAEEFYNKWSHHKSEKDHKNGLLRIKKSYNGDAVLSAHTYNTLIDTYGKAGKLHEACETFERMLQKGIQPTTVTFNTMMHMHGIRGELNKVALLLQRMNESKCSPDTRTYNILIFVHAKHNDIELAVRYLAKMKEASLEPDSISYRTLLYAFSMRHMIAEAEELISEMDDRGLEIDEFTQSSLTRMYVEAGMIQRSWSWFLKFHLQGNMTSTCYSAIMDAYGEKGYISEAQKVFDCSLQVKKPTVLEFNVLVKAYGVSMKFDEACYFFDMMEQYGLIPDRCSYNSIIQMLSSASLPQKAMVYLRKMQESQLINDCIPYCAVISSYVKLGYKDMAVGLYEEMIGKGIEPDIVVFGVLISAFAEAGSVRETAYFISLMRNQDLAMNAVICKALIKLYTKLGYLREAQEAYNMLHKLGTGFDVYTSNCMVDMYSRQSMVIEAEEIFNDLSHNGEANEFTYAMMLCMYMRNRSFTEAYEIARKMREQGLKELLSYNQVLRLYLFDGRYKEAVATFREMLESSIRPDASTFKSLASILTKHGVPKCAIEKLELMEGENGLQAWASTLKSVVDLSGLSMMMEER